MPGLGFCWFGLTDQAGEALESFGVGTVLRGGEDDEHRAGGAGHRVGVPVQAQLSDQRVDDAHPAARRLLDVVSAPQLGEFRAAGRESAMSSSARGCPGSAATWARSIAVSSATVALRSGQVWSACGCRNRKSMFLSRCRQVHEITEQRAR